MKIMKLIYFVTLLLLASVTPQVFCARGASQPVSVAQSMEAATVVEQGIGTLAATYVESDFIIAAAADHIKAAHELLFSKDTTIAEDVKNTNTIIVQSKVIVLAQQKLEKTQDIVAKKVETEVAPESYWSRFVAGVKNVGSGIVGFFTPGKGTDEEKAIAHLMVKILTEQEVKIAEKFALLQQNLNEAEKIALKQRYDAVVTQIEAAIYEQQTIIGDVKSGMIKRGLLLGAAAAGTAATGMFIKDKYFTEDESIMSRIKTAAEKTDIQKAIAEGRAERQAPTVQDFQTVFTDKKLRDDISTKSQELFDSGKKKAGEAYKYVTKPVDPAVKARLDAEGEDTEGFTWKDLQDYKKALEVDRDIAERLDKENKELEIFTGEDFAPIVSDVKAGLTKAAQETDISKAIREGQELEQAPTIGDFKEVSDGIGALWESAKEKAKAGLATVKEGAQNVGSKLKDLRDSEAVQGAWEKAKDYGTQAKDSVVEKYEELKSDLISPSANAEKETILSSLSSEDEEENEKEGEQEVLGAPEELKEEDIDVTNEVTGDAITE